MNERRFPTLEVWQSWCDQNSDEVELCLKGPAGGMYNAFLNERDAQRLYGLLTKFLLRKSTAKWPTPGCHWGDK
jgi:hypothetical protein